MRWLAVLLAGMALAACPAKADSPVASVEVVREGDRWTADYRFHQQSPVWVLALSPLTRERPRSFRSSFEGVLKSRLAPGRPREQLVA